MTKTEMYAALLNNCHYKPHGYYPSTRYSETCGKDSELMNLKDAKILVNGRAYAPHNVEVESDYDGIKITVSAYMNPVNVSAELRAKIPAKPLTITNVIFNPPATIVFWSDKTKTIVKANYDYEHYDPEKGIAMAIAKKMMGNNKGSYYEMFKRWRKKWDEQNTPVEDFNIDIPKNSIEKLAD